MADSPAYQTAAERALAYTQQNGAPRAGDSIANPYPYGIGGNVAGDPYGTASNRYASTSASLRPNVDYDQVVRNLSVTSEQANPYRGIMQDSYQIGQAEQDAFYNRQSGLDEAAHLRDLEYMQSGADLTLRNTGQLMGAEYAYGISGMREANTLNKDFLGSQTDQAIRQNVAQGEVEKSVYGAKTGADTVAYAQRTESDIRRDLSQAEQARLGISAQGEQQRLTTQLEGSQAQELARVQGAEARAGQQISEAGATERSRIGAEAQLGSAGLQYRGQVDAALAAERAQSFSATQQTQQAQIGAGATVGAAGLQSQAQIEAARQSAEASKYGSTTAAGASMYGADRQLQGAQIAADSAERQVGLQGQQARLTAQTQGEQQRLSYASQGEQERSLARVQGEETRATTGITEAGATQRAQIGAGAQVGAAGLAAGATVDAAKAAERAQTYAAQAQSDASRYAAQQATEQARITGSSGERVAEIQGSTATGTEVVRQRGETERAREGYASAERSIGLTGKEQRASTQTEGSEARKTQATSTLAQVGGKYTDESGQNYDFGKGTIGRTGEESRLTIQTQGDEARKSYRDQAETDTRELGRRSASQRARAFSAARAF